MKYNYGHNSDEYFYGTAGSDIIYALGGNDQIYVALDENSPYAFDRVYAGNGNDLIGFDLSDRVVKALKSGDLISPFADGGAGRDRLVLYYDGAAKYGLQDIRSVIDAKNIELLQFSFLSSEGKINGTSSSNWLYARTEEATSVDGGAGNDRIDGFRLNGKLSIDGGAGNDLLSAYFIVGGSRADVTGGAGNDMFIFDSLTIYDSQWGPYSAGMNIEDFVRGKDKIVIDLSSGKYSETGYNFDIEKFDKPQADATAYRDHVKYNEKTGALVIDGHTYGHIDGSLHLTASDFLFV